jgi:hypothetical protein
MKTFLKVPHYHLFEQPDGLGVSVWLFEGAKATPGRDQRYGAKKFAFGLVAKMKAGRIDCRIPAYAKF